MSNSFSKTTGAPFEEVLTKVVVETAWRVSIPVLDVWAVAPPSDFPNYAAGTWGRSLRRD
jgi:hypothetical protein